MKFSKSQYENFIRVITVAAVAKQFRSAAIVKAVVDAAKSDGKVATGRLTLPSLTGSIIPSRDDRWISEYGKIDVSVGSVENGLPSKIEISVMVSYGVDGRFSFIRKDIDAEYPSNKFPNVNQINTWIRAKSQRGLMSFNYKGKPLDTSNDKHINSVAYLIARGISRDGIKYKSNFASAFNESDRGVLSTLQKGFQKAKERIIEKYEEDVYSALLEAIDLNIV